MGLSFPRKDVHILTNGVAGSCGLQNSPPMFRADGDNGTILPISTLSLEKRMFLSHSGSISKGRPAFDRWATFKAALSAQNASECPIICWKRDEPRERRNKKHRIRDANCGQDIIVLVEKEQNFYTRPKAPTYVSLLPNGPAYAICIQWWGQLVACGFDWSWFRNSAWRNTENKTLNCRRSPFDRTQWNGRSH